jgi:hypothetical protein
MALFECVDAFDPCCVSPVQYKFIRVLVRFEVSMSVTMKNAIFWDIEPPLRTSQETHYVSATESSQLMLCKI